MEQMLEVVSLLYLYNPKKKEKKKRKEKNLHKIESQY